MHKLNKEGWGLREMLVLSGILILFLIIAIYLIYSLYSEFDREATVGYYYELEEKLENQASVYLNDYYPDPLTSDNLTITRGVLRTYNLDVDLVDKNDKACSGYVIANKTHGQTNVNAYIKCEHYETEGYEEWRN